MSATKKPAKKTPAKKKPAKKKPAKKASASAAKSDHVEATIIYANDVKNPTTRKRFLGWLFN